MNHPCKDYVKESRDPKEVVDCIKEHMGDSVTGLDLREYRDGQAKKPQFHHLWVTVDRDRFLELVDLLMEIDFLHFHITSGDDEGDVVQLNYHFSLFRVAGRGNRLGVTISVRIPKDDLVIPSLWSRIPGIEFSEREMREMLGVDPDGLPNKALVFLPEHWNEDIKPWRRDETGPGPEDVRDLS